MSRLSELIAELCPDGVEYVTLEEACCYPRERISIDSLSNGAYVSVENLAQDFGGLTGEVATTKPGTAVIRFNKGDVLVGNIRPYLKKVWLADFEGGTNGDVLVFRIKDSFAGRLLPEFVFAQLASDRFIEFDMKYAKGAKMPRGDKKAVLRYRIPVPPIEVQREVVRILDEYTAAHDELIKAFEAEMRLVKSEEQMAKEYLWKRTEEATDEYVSLGSLCDEVITPIRAKPTVFEGDTPWCKLEDVTGRTIGESLSGKCVSDETISSMRLKPVPKGTLLCSCSATLGVYAVAKCRLVTNQRFIGLVLKDSVSTDFILHYLRRMTPRLSQSATGSTNAYISRKKFEDVQVPVVEIGRQIGLVELLEKVEDSAGQLISEIQAEISLHEAQLKAIRDQLLSFPEKAA